MKIVKRDGKIVNYDRNKIYIAISKANSEVLESQKINNDLIEEIICYIEGLDKKRMLVEDIQDIIENKLMQYGKYELAKKYIVYRYTRALVRKKNTVDESILGLIRQENEHPFMIKSDKNALLASTQRDLIAGEVSKDLTKRILLPPKISKAHDQGEIFFHDSDYFLQSIFDCCYLDLGNMLTNGTVINNKLIETPKTFLVACLVTTQIIDSISSCQYGGVSIDISHLAKYIKKSKEKLYSELEGIDSELANKLVNDRFQFELSSGIQLFQYQLNTLMTTNGQYPSVTLFLNLHSSKKYEEETAILIEEILKQRATGIKYANGEYITPRFPKLVYVLDDTNNLTGGKYDYITQLAINCSKSGGYPDYISSKIMKKLYKNNVFSPIGDNHFLIPYQQDDTYKFEGRFNQGHITINLPQIAILAYENETKFWSLLEDRLEVAREALMCKFYALRNTTSETSPVHWIYGGISRLNKEDVVDQYLRDCYSTLSLGFVGLYETVRIIKHTSGITPIGHEFALKIVKRIRHTIDKWKDTTGLGFCLYAGEDLESSYYFANIDKNKYGVIEKVTDKGYYSDSYSIYSKELSLFDRLLLEKEFVNYCNGGSVHKIDVSKLDNDKNAKEIIQFIHGNLLYCQFNIQNDECKVCGYKGNMYTSLKHTYECPNCSNKDKSKFIIRKKLNE